MYGGLAVLVLVVVSAGGIALRVHQVERNPLHAMAEHGARATVRVVLDDTPSPLHGPSYGTRNAESRAVVRGDLRGARIGGRWVSIGGEVLLLVPSEQWRELIAGQEVTVEAGLVPPRSAEPLVAVLSVYGPPTDPTTAPPWQRGAAYLRARLRETSTTVLGPAAAGLLPGLVVGDTSMLPSGVVREFRDAGLSHLTAVSGANLAIVCGAVLLLLRLLRIGPVLAASAAGLALLGFVLLAGPEPSVLRAAVMGAITLLALVLGRERSALPALSAGVVGLVLVVPGLATSVGFALSVAATAALVLLAPAWSAALHSRGVPIGVAEALAVPAAAQVATAPLVAALSGRIGLLAVLANVLAGPMVAPATVLGVTATVTASVLPWFARALVWLAAPELEWVLAVAHHAAAVPGAALEWPSGARGGLLLAVFLVIASVALRVRRVRRVLAVTLVLVVAVLVPVRTLRPAWPVPGWSMVVCDVGQGDGLALATGEPNTAVIVDTGPDSAAVDDCLDRLGIRRVPLIVITHLHADHMGGLASVLEGRAVGTVAVGGASEPAWAMEEIRRASAEAGTRLIRIGEGQRLRWSRLALEVLAPTVPPTESEASINDSSLVLMATTTAGRILLTGDIELRAQTRLLSSGRNLRADVLKVPHHGSRTTIPRFLHVVRPRLALISVGHDNDYGHPSRMVVGSLTRAGARVLRTDRRGDIAVLAGRHGPATVSRGDPLQPDS